MLVSSVLKIGNLLATPLYCKKEKNKEDIDVDALLMVHTS